MLANFHLIKYVASSFKFDVGGIAVVAILALIVAAAVARADGLLRQLKRRERVVVEHVLGSQ